METADLTLTTRHALKEAVLNPRFYTTDFDAIDQMDTSGKQHEFEWIRDEFAKDYNKYHFVRTEAFHDAFKEMPDRDLFVEFLERSCTAEFSGCLLYTDMYKTLKNPTLAQIFRYMSRDEGRHAGFLNKTMADLDVRLDLNMLRSRKKYTHFKPKFIFYATYLSEKIGYARYILIYRHLEKHRAGLIHPIFDWFEEWCNDEYRHGEFFSLLMRSQPKLLTGVNVYWVRFFLLAVCLTMYMNDARRAQFYRNLGLDWRDYDHKVIRLTNQIATQVFPYTLPVDDPQFWAHLDACVRHDEAMGDIAGGGPRAAMKKLRGRAGIARHFVGAFLRKPVKTTEANRWRGLAGFPNYPGTAGSPQSAVASQESIGQEHGA